MMATVDKLGPDTGIAHCLHHNIHFEWCYGFKERLAVIDGDKPPSEQAVRKANFWLFSQADLPSWKKVDAASVKAEAAAMKYDAAKAEYIAVGMTLGAVGEKFGAAWAKYLADNLPAIQALHDKLVAEHGYICTWNGKDIFKEAHDEQA